MLQSIDLKHGFRKTASLRRYRILVAAVLVHQLAILLALTGARAYIHLRDVALGHVVLLLWAFPLCLVQRYIAHAHVFITRC